STLPRAGTTLPGQRDEPTHPIGTDPRRRKRGGMSLRVWLGIGGLVVLVLGGVGLWAWLRPGGKPPDDKPPAKPAIPPGWIKFSPPGDFLSVALPGKPFLQTIPVQAGALKFDQIQYLVKEGESFYVVSYAEFPGLVFTEKDLGDPARRISELVMNNLKKPKLIARTRITLDGFPGVESEVEGETNQQQQVHCVLRSYGVRHRMITLVVVVPLDEARSEKVRMFFDSFRVNP